MVNKKWWKKIFHDRDMAKILFGGEKSYHSPDTRLAIGFIKSTTGIKSPAKVLDVCCGIGRHSIELAKIGYDVTGIDISNFFLSLARKQAKKERLKADFKCRQMDDLKEFKSKYDIVINLFTSFGYYEAHRGNFKTLKQMAQALKTGGYLTKV